MTSNPTTEEQIDQVVLKDTLVVVLLDQSGSMHQMKDAALESLNGLITSQKERPDGLRFSLMFFNARSIQLIHDAVSIKGIAHIRPDQFNPDSGTPLLDATARAMAHAMQKKTADEQVMIVIITDGLENQSVEWTKHNLFAWIQEKQDAGWEFMFFGANQDAWAVAQDMGMRGTAGTFDTNTIDDTIAFASAAVSSYREGTYEPEVKDFTLTAETTVPSKPKVRPLP